MEAETVIMMLPPGEQDYIRHQVAKNITRLYQQQGQQTTYRNIKEKREDKTVKQIKDKEEQNNSPQSRQRKFHSHPIFQRLHPQS